MGHPTPLAGDSMAGDRFLLALEGLDHAADALRAQRAALPERAALREREAERAAFAAVREDACASLATLGREEREAERAVGELLEKVRELEAVLYAGKVTSPRELLGLQAELDGFRRRLAEQEEAALAWMAREEEAETEIARSDARSRALVAEEAELREALTAAETRIDAELARIEAERAELSARVAPAVRAVYEKLRASPRLGGQVTARLQANSCGRCRVVLPISVAGRVRPDAEAPVQCPRCTRILLP
jgi:uncharacterized protein